MVSERHRYRFGPAQRRYCAAIGILSGLVVTHAAVAAGDAIQEIVVTAEKRDSTVEKTPISITAISGTELLDSGVSSLTGVAEEVPGISMKTGGPGQTEFEMRGLNSAGGNSPTVGFYLDETPVTSFAYATSGKVVIDPDLYDLNRVEVLRGPQGTLYGSGSMGGTIRLLTNEPQFNEYHASGELIGGGTEGGGLNGGENGMVNIPLVQDKLALRIVETDKYTSGWIDRIVLDPFPLPTNGGLTRGNVLSAPIAQKDENVNWEHLESVRATLLAKPIDNLTIEPMVMGQRITSGGQSLIDNPPGTVEAHYQPFDTPEPYSDDFLLLAMTIKYRFDDFEIVSATSKWRRSMTQVQDGSEVLQDVLALPSLYANQGGLGYDPWTERDSASQVSQEVRIASTNNAPFQWLVGMFYGDLSSVTDQSSYDNAATALFGTNVLFNEHVPQNFNQNAAFGEASYQITDSLKATAGLRWFSFDNSFSTTEYGFFGPYGTLQRGGSTSEAQQSGFNPKFNLAYLPTDDLTIYATAAKGFRPGGGNEIIPTSGTQEGEACGADLAALGKSTSPLTYGPDTVWDYELGEKARLLDGRVTINGDIYYEDWAAVQRAITLNCGYIYSDNAGSASVYGSELEISGKVTPEWTVNLTGNYTYATYTQSSVEAGVVKGERLPDVPMWTTSASLIYRHDLSDEYALVGRLTNSYIGPMTDVTYYVNKLPGYDLMSARIGIEADKWSGFFFINNLTDEHALLTDINSQVLNIPTMTRVATNQPRTFGIDLNYQF
jgi:outer membrane receptor protein involved in Fe transport